MARTSGRWLYRGWALWLLGYPEAARADIDRALNDAREIGQAGTLLYALIVAGLTYILWGDYAAANAQVDEAVTLADEKDVFYWKAFGMMNQGCVLGSTGKLSEAVQIITSGITAYRSTGSTLFVPWYLSNLAMTYAQLGKHDDA